MGTSDSLSVAPHRSSRATWSGEGGIRIGAEVGVDAGQGRHQVDDHLPVEEIGRELNFEVNPAGIAGGVALLDEVDRDLELGFGAADDRPHFERGVGWVTCDV